MGQAECRFEVADEGQGACVRLTDGGLVFAKGVRNHTTVECWIESEFHRDLWVESSAFRDIALVIEDKTHSEHHSNQVVKYHDAAQHRAQDCDELHFLYFKTGVLTNIDRQVTDHGWQILDASTFGDFLKRQDVDEAIFNAYKDFFFEAYAHSLTSDFKAVAESGTSAEVLGDNESQYKYVRALMQRFLWIGPFNIGTSRFPTKNDGVADAKPGDVYRSSSSGRPWSQVNILVADNVYGGEQELLFYRIDRLANRPHYLALRQYVRNIDKTDAEACQLKLRRRDRHRALFREATESVRHSLRFGEPREDRGAVQKESWISYLEFDSETNTLERVLDEFPGIHFAFLARLESSDLI